MHAAGNVRHRARDVGGVGQCAEKVSAETVEQIQFATCAGFDHLGRGHAGPVGDVEAVLLAQRGDILGRNRFAAGKRR